MADKIVSLFAGLFVGVYVARYLGPEQFGLLSYATSFVALFTAFATLGLDSIVVRNLVQNIEDRDRLLGTAFILKLLGGILLFGAVAFAVQFTSSDSYTKLLIFIIAGGMIFESLKVIDFYFQSQVLGRFLSAAGICALCASSLLRISLVFFQASLVWFAAAQAFSTGILALMLLFFYFKHGRSVFKWHFDWNAAKELLRDSWPLLFSSVSFVVFSNIDNIMIQHFFGSHEVGIYKVAFTLVTLWYFLPGLLLNSLFPAVVSAKNNDMLYKNRLKKLGSMLLFLSIAITTLYISFGKLIIDLTYGEKYQEAIDILLVLSWVNILIFFNSFFNKWMTIENKSKRILLFHVVTAIFNTSFNYLLIPKYGAIGAAYALIVSLLLTYTIYFILFKEVYSMFLMCLFFFKNAR